jgi:hypothetical protein
MVGQRAAGNGNFDIDAIRMAANAMENAPAVIEQPIVDPMADAFAADVEDMVDELRFNPSSNLAEEAAQIGNAAGAAKLGAGVMADLRAAVQLQGEKAANGADAFLRGDRVWEERKERDEKDRKEQVRITDMADDANNGQLSTTPDRHGLSEQNYAELNTELQTRAGQERFMAFLRMMNPDMTDAEIDRYVHDAEVIAAVRSGRDTPDQRDDYDAMDSAHRENVSRVMDGYSDWRGQESDNQYRTSSSAEKLTRSNTVEVGADARASQIDVTVAVEQSELVAPVAARDEGIAARAPDATSAFNAVASNIPAPQPSRVAELQLAAARAPAADQSVGF